MNSEYFRVSPVKGRQIEIMKAKVITDSGSGLSREQAEKLGMGFLPLQVIINEKSYRDGVDLDIPTLYEAMRSSAMPTTSQPLLYDVEELFDQYNEEGVTDLILITLSNGLSGTNANVQAAAARHNLKVHTLDLYTTLYIEKYAAIAAQQLLEQGKGLEEIIGILKDAIDTSAGYLIVEDLDHLAAGGRLTPMAAKLGGLLKIKPILEVSKNTEGRVDVYDKVRTFVRAQKKAVEHMKETMDPEMDYVFFVLNGDNDEGTENAQKLLKEAFGEDIEIHVDPMYAVIAAHTGLGSVGMQYIRRIEGVQL